MKAQWTDGQYNVFYLVISKELRVSVAWDGGTKVKNHDVTEDGYKITFLGHTLKGRPRDLETAKKQAVQLACMVLTGALEAIQ
jgi:hypothetical protein